MRPPKLAATLLHWAVPESSRGFVELDLEEEFYSYQLGKRGYAAARAWYWRQSVSVDPADARPSHARS